MNGWSRRQFMVGAGVAGAGLLAGCGRLPWQGQAEQHTRAVRIGWIRPNAPGPDNPWQQAFLDGLRSHGYIEGQNLSIEVRSAPGQLDRLPERAAELVDAPVDLIFSV